jgi:hypothetical protein
MVEGEETLRPAYANPALTQTQADPPRLRFWSGGNTG